MQYCNDAVKKQGLTEFRNCQGTAYVNAGNALANVYASCPFNSISVFTQRSGCKIPYGVSDYHVIQDENYFASADFQVENTLL